MREIKFRAWDSENKKYIYNPMEYELECIARIKGRDDWKYESFIGFSPMEFEIFVIDQFTGLHDKNGKEIYEGDIVNYTHDKGFNVVVYSEIIPAFVTKDIQGYEYLPSIEDYDSWIVIGNIHENPELIK